MVYNYIFLDSKKQDTYNEFWVTDVSYPLIVTNGENGWYMGDTYAYKEYVYEKYEEYFSFPQYVGAISDLHDQDLEYISLGSHIGVIIQRVLEIASAKGVSITNNELFYTQDTLSSLVDVLRNSFGQCYSDTTLTEYYCSDTVSCPDVTQICKYFTSFYGSVNLKSGYKNIEGYGTIEQMINNGTEYNIFNIK